VGHFNNLNLKYAKKLKGFDPNGIFVEHLLVVSFNISFINTIMNEDKNNVLGTPARNTCNLKTILRTNEVYKHKRKGAGEKSAQSLTATTKTTTSRSNAPRAYLSKKVTHIYSGGGRDKNPPFGKIEISHELPTRKK
jgi:hypothetical protein